MRMTLLSLGAFHLLASEPSPADPGNAVPQSLFASGDFRLQLGGIPVHRQEVTEFFETAKPARELDREVHEFRHEPIVSCQRKWDTVKV
ncbi:MAG: hypothetical protein HY076_01150 [Candidatus Eisenbacteria bacterium]|uniref:Uncharacterized protein n=1 Tax=Eiseniibacteriota bacterium TaxID=2212470 RepID=A0A9D6QI43_UNCEI|nr:hypothetical protein [Candidatus Eisenbacteria bacterium]